MIDLAAELIRAIQQQRERLNASRIAHGEAGQVEIHVNPAMNRIVVQVLIPDERRVA